MMAKTAKATADKKLDERGVKAAIRFLEHREFETLEEGWKCKAGKVDIIGRDEDDLVFVQVKTRSNTDKGLPEEAVTAASRKKMERIAGHFLADYDFVDMRVRFDVISILAVNEDRAFLRHHRDAFSLCE